MPARHVIALVLAALTVPVLALGILDPMEGGMAMLAAGVMILLTWLVGRVPVPRLEWIGWVATVVVGAVTLAAAVVLWNEGVTAPGRGLPWWLAVLLVIYEVGVVATFAGGVWNVVRHVMVLRNKGIPVAGVPAR